MASTAAISKTNLILVAALLLALAVPRLLEPQAEDVRRQPLNARAWQKLAAAELREGDEETATRFYVRSLEVGRYIPGFMSERLMLGVKLWPHLPENAQSLTAEQANLLWKHDRDNFLILARLPPLKESLRDMLAQYYPQEISWFLKRRGE